MNEEWGRKVMGWKQVSSQNNYTKLVVGVDKHRTIGKYGPGMKKMRDEREALWFKLGEDIAG